MNESEETEEVKLSPPSILTCSKDSRPCPAVNQYQLDAPLMQVKKYSVLILR